MAKPPCQNGLQTSLSLPRLTCLDGERRTLGAVKLRLGHHLAQQGFSILIHTVRRALFFIRRESMGSLRIAFLTQKILVFKYNERKNIKRGAFLTLIA